MMEVLAPGCQQIIYRSSLQLYTTPLYFLFQRSPSFSFSSATLEYFLCLMMFIELKYNPMQGSWMCFTNGLCMFHTGCFQGPFRFCFAVNE